MHVWAAPEDKAPEDKPVSGAGPHSFCAPPSKCLFCKVGKDKGNVT